MQTISLETAVIAALIGFAGALLGQLVGVFLGARYSADLARKTQLELADIAFQRDWRERLVRPYLELVGQRLALASEFTSAVASGDSARAFEVARTFHRTEALLHSAQVATLGDHQLTAAGDAWFDVEQTVSQEFFRIANKGVVDESDASAIVETLIDLVDKTAALNREAGRFAASGPLPSLRDKRTGSTKLQPL